MAQFCGKWQLISSTESFVEYMKAVGVSADKIEQAKTGLTEGAKLFQDISKDGSSWVIKVITTQGEKVDTYPEGQETEVTTLDGRKVKVVYSLDGDTLVEQQTGDGFSSRNVRQVTGDQMTMTFTADKGPSCTRVYKRV